MTLEKAVKERLEKAKYIKRTGSPGSYKYQYKEGKGIKGKGVERKISPKAKGQISIDKVMNFIDKRLPDLGGYKGEGGITKKGNYAYTVESTGAIIGTVISPKGNNKFEVAYFEVPEGSKEEDKAAKIMEDLNYDTAEFTEAISEMKGNLRRTIETKTFEEIKEDIKKEIG